MRRIAFLALGLSLGLIALSDSASARPRGLSGLFGVITKPLGAILRPPRGISRRAAHRRPAASRTRQARPAASPPSAAVATKPPATAAPAVAAGVAGTTTVAAAAAAAPSTEGAAAPTAAPAQPDAVLTQPADEAPPRVRDGSRLSRGAPPNRPASAAQPPPQVSPLGPPNWPTAFEDVLGFTLWPNKYGERLRAHGIGDVMSALFTPSMRIASTSGQGTARARAETPASDANGAASACSIHQQEPADWPAKPIQQAMDLNEVQRAALDQLRSAVQDALAAIRTACREDTPRTSAERLQAMQGRLWAVRDAVMLVRAPLINFHRSLTGEQKKQFVIEARQPDPRLAQMEQRGVERRGGKPQIPREMARMCGMSAANEWPLRQIEQAIQANEQQKASLDALQKKSTEMGQLLIASCLQPIAATPDARLDQALDRLTAMLFAITNITLALNDFHGQLSDGQKAKLEPFGL